MRNLLPHVALAWLLLSAWPAVAATATPALLPVPRSIELRPGSLALTAKTLVTAPPGDAGARAAAEWLVDRLAIDRGFRLGIGVARSRGGIRFVRAKGGKPEGYRLDVGRTGAVITASDDAGLFYGAVTLWQLATSGAADVPAIVIEDSPRFAWRGLMLDSARHFQSPAFVKRLIDAMAANKLNTLHWHLTDDQGWRIEIAKYPRLTEIGGWRIPASAPGAPLLPRTGGFYTQSQISEIVAYAAARSITIVPEIEMPGHALAAIRAYPELGNGVVPPPGIESDWGVFPYPFNVEEGTFAFLQDVLDEVMALFPGRYIHVGGDEAAKDQWIASPQIQARMRALGIADEKALQGWFVGRIGRYLEAHGRRLIGWDEILEGGVPAGATVMSWQGIDGAVKAAQAGHDAVLAAAPTLYFDHRQGGGAAEPPGRGQIVSLADVYAFDPAPGSLTPGQQRHIIGLQGNLWTEHVRTEARAAYMIFPRAAAVAELGWSGPATHDFAGFAARLAPQLERLRGLGLEVAPIVPASNEPVSARRRDDTQLKLCTEKLVLSLEDDAPADGPRAAFLTDIMNPCWIFEAAPLDGIAAIALDVGLIPFNFQIGKDIETIRFRPPATAAGEFEVRIDGCESERIAVLPLAAARANPGVTTLRAAIAPRAGAHDLCFTYTAAGPDPMWALDAVELVGAK